MKRILPVIFISAICCTVHSQDISVATFEVDAGKYERLNTPVSIVIDKLSVNDDSCSFTMFETSDNVRKEVPVQVDTDLETRLWWILDGITAPGELRQFELFYTREKGNSARLKSIINDANLRITQNGKEVLQYNHSVHYPPAGVDTVFRRSAFIHPLWSPSGNILTRINPPDHYHHYGIWNPWTKVHYRKKEIDFWNLNKGQGTVKFNGYVSTSSGNVFAGFRSLHNHVIFEEEGRESNILNEIWDVRAWNININTTSQVYLVDLLSLLSCATEDTVILDTYRYGGGIGYRASASLTRENSRVTTSAGYKRADADATRARWANVRGSFTDSITAGIVFFSHPSNRDHPEPMRVWPSDSNGGRGDMFFEFSPIRHNKWILEPGKRYRQKYRMLIYDGKIDSLTIERIWTDFAFPPEVRILDNK
ncbi:MAG: PmoA family protein [Bacteroidales bacterium]|nr:PmoA family protein [Bacteroidales bacterium]